jgi:hypothetical protein
MVARATRDVPAQNGLPDAEQYQRAVTDAVADFSARLPLYRTAVVTLQPGVPSYALPADFLRFIRLQPVGLAQFGNVAVTGAGLVPLGESPARERIVITAQLTLIPTPAYGGARTMEYAARYTLDQNNAYPDLSEEAAGAVALKANANLLRLKAGKAAEGAWSYRIGDESVDKKGLSASLFEAANAAEADYLRRVEVLRGTVMARGRLL